MQTNNNKKLLKMGMFYSFTIYFSAAFLIFIATKLLIPFFHKQTGFEIILLWFIIAGLCIFFPLIITGYIILKTEGYTISKNTFTKRLRFVKIKKTDIFYSIFGIVAVGIFSFLIIKLIEYTFGKFEHTPSFMEVNPINKEKFWFLFVWLPYWLLNIFGEEFLWRGVMLPRQEIAFGRFAWLIHGFGWTLFHLAFGWQLVLTLIPLLFIQSFIVQVTKNSWNGVIMHACINGPSFIAISLGWF